MSTRIVLSAACFAAFAGACSTTEEASTYDGERLRNGDTPECSVLDSERLDGIGMVFVDDSACTATLIGPRAILTAAHCFDHTTAAPDVAAGRAVFEIDPWNHCGRNRKFQVRRWLSFASSPNDGRNIDIAVAMLDQSISATGAVRHMSIANGYPATGTQVTLYGRGYTNDPWQDTFWGDSLRRAAVAYDFGAPAAEWISRVLRESPAGTSHLDHGDSGGPGLTAGGEIFVVNAAVYRDLDGKDLEYFADAVQMNRRTALGSVASAFGAGVDWPSSPGSNGWPCADGTLEFCDADHPSYLRQCSSANDLFAAQRKYCPGGCQNGACLPHVCEGLSGAECTNGCITHLLSCAGTAYSACLPDDLTHEEACAAVHGETFGAAPSTGGTSTGSAECCVSDNMCANPPNTPGCPMTAPGGYCDPNGDGSFTDANWVVGFEEHQAKCGGSASNPPKDAPPPSDDPPASSCSCAGDNRCANPPSTAGCPMTAPGGYCDPNGDGSFSDADWMKGWTEHQAQCG